MKYASRTARRYARALFSLAEEAGEQERVTGEVAAVARVFEEVEELGQVLASRHVPEERKVAVLERLFRSPEASEEDAGELAAGPVHDLTFHFLQLLLHNRRVDLMGEIAVALGELLDKRQGIVRAVVTTAVPLLAAERDMITEKLKALTSAPEVVLESKVSRKLIGGVVIHVGEHVIDASVRTYLESMRERLRRVKVGDGGANGMLHLDLEALREQSRRTAGE